MVKRPKKGFTLVEMLVVVVIIAVLISVVIPIISTSTIKARAAANASNLRSVEGQITMYMVMNEGVYDEFEQKSETIDKLSTGILGRIFNIFAGKNAAENFALSYKRLDDDGTGTLWVPSTEESIKNISRAKGFEAPNRSGKIAMVVQEGEYMSVYITEDGGAVAFYGDWNKDDFADVAEDGIYDGTTVGTEKPDGNIFTVAACIAAKKHRPGPDCICSTCGGDAHWGADAPYYLTSETMHTCERGHQLSTCESKNSYEYVDATNHKCTICDEPYSHAWSNLTCSICHGEKPICQYTGICTEIKVEGTDYCQWHQLINCTQKLNDGTDCTGQYSNGSSCPNAWNHAIITTCPVCGNTGSSIWGGKCFSHQSYKKCSTPECGTWYNGDACTNTAVHGHVCEFDKQHNCTVSSTCTKKELCTNVAGYCVSCLKHKDNCSNCGTAHTCAHTIKNGLTGANKKCSICGHAKLTCPCC